MSELLEEIIFSSAYFGAALTLAAYMFGCWLHKKLKLIIFNPILVAELLCIAILKLFDIDFEAYNQGAKYISFFLNLATISLALLLYEQLEILKRDYKAILIGITAAVITSAVTILLFSMLFKFSHTEYITLLPHSITTAMGMALSEQFGGYISVTVGSIVVTGIFGNATAAHLMRLFRITDPVARGVAIGSASHALGTAKAIEIGEIEGAISGLSMAVAGLITVIVMAVFAGLY